MDDEPVIKLAGARTDEMLAYLNAMTPISVYFNDKSVVHTTVQRVDDVLLREKRRRKAAR